MNVEGIWKVEMLGPYGWEALSTAFLENGRYLSASQDHYTIGRYEVDGNSVRVVATIHSHGDTLDTSAVHEPREFGFEGQFGDGHISGQAEDSAAQQSITLRGTRLGNLA